MESREGNRRVAGCGGAHGEAVVRLQPISYEGRVVACATATRFFLADELRCCPVGEPEVTFVMFMCAYAGEVLRGTLPGPYDDEQARRYARAALVPGELTDVERRRDVVRHLRDTADALRLPVHELELVLAEADRDHEGANQ